jgi:hypothetical protein
MDKINIDNIVENVAHKTDYIDTICFFILLISMPLTLILLMFYYLLKPTDKKELEKYENDRRWMFITGWVFMGITILCGIYRIYHFSVTDVDGLKRNKKVLRKLLAKAPTPEAALYIADTFKRGLAVNFENEDEINKLIDNRLYGKNQYTPYSRQSRPYGIKSTENIGGYDYDDYSSSISLYSV